MRACCAQLCQHLYRGILAQLWLRHCAGPSQPPPKAGAKQESGVEVKQEAGARGAAVKAEPRVAAGADPRTAPLAGGAGVKPALNDEPGGAGPLGEPLTQTQPQTQTQAQTQTQPPAGSLPLMLPDKINRNKVSLGRQDARGQAHVRPGLRPWKDLP